MRLLTRLSVSHALPVLLVAGAMALLLVALVQMSLVLTALKEDELGTLREEGALHRAMWEVDMTMRRSYDPCARGEADDLARARIVARVEALERAMAVTPGSNHMMTLAAKYAALGRDVTGGPTCERLLDRAYRVRRETLDEKVTDLWVDRLQVLHEAASAKEEEARKMGVTAAWGGLTLTLASLFVAWRVARRLARSLNQPLVSLSESARRVGGGDLATPIAVEGPIEIRELADDLERMRQQLAQLDALKQGFLASVSHELRTPLSKIREALALMQDGVVGPMEARQLRVLAIARQACEREIRMVSTLLDLSRLRSGSPVRLRDATSVDAVMESAIDDERSEAELKGVQIVVEREGEAPTTRLDPILLERAFANIVRNAVAVSDRGQRVVVRRTIGKQAGAKQDGERVVHVSVSDEGPGVPEAIRKIMFEPFVTQAVPQSGKSLGIGLGLALAREIARAHGGDLALDTRVARGASLVMTLPLHRSTSDAPVVSHAPQMPAAPTGDAFDTAPSAWKMSS